MYLRRFAVLPALFVWGCFVAPAAAVDDFTVSNFGNGSQIWFQAEDFDERIPDTDDYYVLSAAPAGEEAFGDSALNTINRNGGPGGRISYNFNIDQLGEAGTWYFWGRVINPNNMSDFMLVEGHPGDVIPTTEPFTGSFNNDQRLFERDTGPPFGWSGGSEGHIKELQDGENTMHIVHRSGNPDVFWDVMMWTDDPDYVPSDDDFLDSEPFVPIDLAGDFNGDSAINAADYQIMLDNFNSEVERGQDGDITFNGYVDYRDFVKLRSTIEAQGGGVESVPEPSCLGLLGIAAMLLPMVRRRRGQVAMAALAMAVAAPLMVNDSFAREVVVVQEEGADYLAFEAEDFFDLNNGDDASGWNIVSTSEPYQSPAPTPPASLILDGSSTNASRNEAIFDFPGGNDQDFVRYRLRFVEDGDYSLYMRYSLFNLRNDGGYGNEDSAYISSYLGIDGELVDTDADPRGPRDDTPSFYATFNGGVNNEGTYGWWNANANSSDNSADNPDAIYIPDLDEEVDFGVAAREAGVSFDRIVFHTNPNLSDAELDALISFDPVTFGLNPNDFNIDGSVDSLDVDIIRANLGDMFSVSESFDKGDGNRDGVVDLRDFLQIRQVLNASDPGFSAVPEPSTATFSMFAVVAVTIVFRKRRSRA